MRSKDSSYQSDSSNTNHRHHHHRCHSDRSADYSAYPQSPYNDVPSAVPCMPPYCPCTFPTGIAAPYCPFPTGTSNPYCSFPTGTCNPYCSFPTGTCNPGCSALSSSYFLASTQGATLTTTPSFISFTPQAQSYNIKGTSPTITFAADGTYLIQLIAPVTTTANYTGTANVSISTNVSGAITNVAPRNYASTTLTAGLTQLPLIFTSIVTVSNICATSAPTTLSYSVNLSSAPTTGSVSLTGGTITAYKLA